MERRDSSCPLCRAAVPSTPQLSVNREFQELLKLTKTAATAAVTTNRPGLNLAYVDNNTDSSDLHLEPSAPLLPSPASPYSSRLDVAAFLAASASREGISPPLSMILSLEPPMWAPDNTSEVCMVPGCSRRFTLMAPKHHCRCCGGLVCGDCSRARLLLPPLFPTSEPQRVCKSCVRLLSPAQPRLAATLTRAAQLPIRDASSTASWRAILHPPVSRSLSTDVYSATVALTHLHSLKILDPSLLASCAGVAVLSLARVGLGWTGGALGTGLIVARRPAGGWSAPCAIAAAAVGVGPQIGLGLSSVIIMLQSPHALRMFTGTALGVGAAMSIAAGPMGREAAASAFAGPKGCGMCVSYCVSRGAFTGLALQSMAVVPRDAANRKFYGCAGLSAKTLLLGDCGLAGPGCAGLHRALYALEKSTGSREAAGAIGGQVATAAARTVSP